MKRLAKVLIAMLVSTSSQASAGALVECGYVGNEPTAEFQSHRDCAEIISGKVTMTGEHLSRMRFNADGLAVLSVSGQHYYVKPGGALLPVLAYDNGADGFSEGLTRSRVAGKVAFFDADFTQVIPPKYDWAWPFEAGRALVCLGCRAGPPDSDNHVAVSGGTWGYVDRKGVEVVPVIYSKEEAQRR